MAVSSSAREPVASYRVASYMSAVASSELTLDPRTRCDPFRYSHTRSAGKLSRYLSEMSRRAVPIDVCRRYLDSVRESIENGVPYLNVPFSREHIDVLDLYLHRSLTGELEPKEALKRVGEEWDRISERAGYEKQLEIWKTVYRTWKAAGYQ